MPLEVNPDNKPPVPQKRIYLSIGIHLGMCVLLALGLALIWFYYHSRSDSIYQNLTHHVDKEKVSDDSPPKLVVPTTGAYTGVFIGAEDESKQSSVEENITLERIEDFESLVHKHQAIIAFSSYWGEQSFPTEAANIVLRHHSVPLIFWSPWDKPYEQNRGPDQFSLEAILKGKWNNYIDTWADQAKYLSSPIFVSLGNEMNGDWFPWSGYYNGADTPLTGSASNNLTNTGPETFKSAFRYIVDRVRKRGANNILWVFHVNNYSIPEEDWNKMKAYYPGDNYVDWLGMSVYGQQFPNGDWTNFKDIFEEPYQQLSSINPNKPVMLTEWGVGDFLPKAGTNSGGDKAKWIADTLNLLETNYPNVHATVYWNERWQNSGDITNNEYSNLRVNSSPKSLEAYKTGIASPYWISEPILQ